MKMTRYLITLNYPNSTPINVGVQGPFFKGWKEFENNSSNDLFVFVHII